MPLSPQRKARKAATERAWRERNRARVAAYRLKPRHMFNKQRRHAADRRIPFLLTFAEWLAIWQRSGHLHERGCRKGQFVMSRKGDVGPYSIGNVRIIRHEDNAAEQKASAATRAKLSRALMGHEVSAATRAKMSAARRAQAQRNQQRAA